MSNVYTDGTHKTKSAVARIAIGYCWERLELGELTLPDVMAAVSAVKEAGGRGQFRYHGADPITVFGEAMSGNLERATKILESRKQIAAQKAKRRQTYQENADAIPG